MQNFLQATITHVIIYLLYFNAVYFVIVLKVKLDSSNLVKQGYKFINWDQKNVFIRFIN